MSSSQAHQQPLQSLTPELRSTVIEQTDSLLLKIVRANLNTQYASKTPLLAELRDAISAHGSASDTELVHDFRRCVPLSSYDAYKPFMAAFDTNPCKEAELENLFAPGLPYFLGVSSATSGREAKIFPKYLNSSTDGRYTAGGPTAAVFFYGYRELKYVERAPGQIVKKIPVSAVSSGILRAVLGWTLAIRLAPVLISDSDIISAIQAVSADVIEVNEFTSVPDDRQGMPTVGYLIEPAGALGLNVYLAPQRLSKGLAGANTKFRMALQDERVRNPSVRILGLGTFAAFRQWKAESMSIGPGQVKVPVVLVDEASRKWLLERVMGEL